MGSLPGVFDMLQYFETILRLVETFHLLNKMRYSLGVVVLLETCDVTNNGRHFGNFRNLIKTARNSIFCALHEK